MPPPGGGELVLGQAAADGSFVTLADGTDVTLVEGAQGGFHVWMKFRAHGVAAGPVTMHRTANRLSDDQLVLKTQGTTTMGAPDAEGWWELPAQMPMFMCPSPVGLSVIDQPIVYRIELDDASGAALASGEVTLVPHCPASAQAFCQQICTG
jgi:hypothetical protein